MDTINGQELSTWGAELVEYTLSPTKIDYSSFWRRLAPKPLITAKTYSGKNIKLVLLVNGDNETEVHKNISNIVAELSNCTLKFNDADFQYDCILDGAPTLEWFGDANNWYRYKVEVSLSSGFAYIQKSSIINTVHFTTERVQLFNIPIEGNLPTPLIVELKVLSGAAAAHTFFVGINKTTAEFELLEGFVTNQFAFMEIGNNDVAMVNSETYKMYLNDVPAITTSFRGDFPFVESSPQTSLPICVEISDILASESDIAVQVTITYKARYI